MRTKDVADAVLRKSFESSNVSKVSRSKIAPAQQRKWIDSSVVCIHHYFSNLLSTQLRLFGNIRFTLLIATTEGSYLMLLLGPGKNRISQKSH